MPTFSQRSLKNLATCDKRLQRVAHECIKHADFTVIEGHRGKAAQDKAVAEGKSRARWPTSHHNANPSRAFDAVPAPLDWNDRESFHALAKVMKRAAKTVGVRIKWGGDFQGFFDAPHWQLDE